MKVRIGLAVLGVSLTAVACGSDRGVAPTDVADRRVYALDALKRGSGAGRTAPWYQNLAELLPNTKYAEPGGTPKAITSKAFVGTVDDVTEGKGFWVPGGDAPGGTMISFDDDRAIWKTVHLSVTVERSLDRVSKAGETVQVGLAAGPAVDVAALVNGFRELGRLVFFLYDDSPVFDYQTDLRAIVEDGAMIATIDGEGGLDVPALEDGRSELMLEGVSTLAELEKRAAEPEQVVALKYDGGILVRA